MRANERMVRLLKIMRIASMLLTDIFVGDALQIQIAKHGTIAAGKVVIEVLHTIQVILNIMPTATCQLSFIILKAAIASEVLRKDLMLRRTRSRYMQYSTRAINSKLFQSETSVRDY